MTTLEERIGDTLTALGARPGIVQQRGLPTFADARQLVCVGLGADGRDKFLTPGAARAWTRMRDAAGLDGIELRLISAFRSFDYQVALIRGKLAAGRDITDILGVNAPPGCSEHHSGRAVDIGYAGTPALEEAFEDTPAFAWLRERAGAFGFRLSYPRDNRHGYLYEPWHWYFAGMTTTRRR